MLCIQQVREKMAQQWDDDIVRNKVAKRVNLAVNKLDNELTLMKKETRNHAFLLSNIQDDAKMVNRKLADLLARDPRQLPIEAIEAAKKKRNPWDF